MGLKVKLSANDSEPLFTDDEVTDIPDFSVTGLDSAAFSDPSSTCLLSPVCSAAAVGGAFFFSATESVCSVDGGF